jgi:antitoxin MazE
MTRKVFKAGNSLVVSLPREAVEALGISEGSEVDLTVDRDQAQVVITAKGYAIAGVDERFATQVNEFIEQYRSALEKLAEGE